MSIYEFKVKDAEGNMVDMEEYKGKVFLIVNTATGCGFTPQYEGLQDLYEKYQAKVEVNGENEEPLFTYLKEQKGGLMGKNIKWNFTKFLVDKNGNVVERFAPTTTPDKIEEAISKLI